MGFGAKLDLRRRAEPQRQPGPLSGADEVADEHVRSSREIAPHGRAFGKTLAGQRLDQSSRGGGNGNGRDGNQAGCRCSEKSSSAYGDP